MERAGIVVAADPTSLSEKALAGRVSQQGVGVRLSVFERNRLSPSQTPEGQGCRACVGKRLYVYQFWKK